MPELPDGDDEPWQAGAARRLMGYPLIASRIGPSPSPPSRRANWSEGSTWVRERRVLVRVQPEWSEEKAANALAHELGHVRDVLYLDARTRDDYVRARHLGWLERNVTVKWPEFLEHFLVPPAN